MPEQPEDVQIEALIAAVRAAHADRIPPGAEQRLHDSVSGLRVAVAALDAYPLTNADEPGTLFAAYRREG